jgi:hypothetical protein
MPMMHSPAGEMEITISSISAEKRRVVAIGRFGTWDSTIYITVRELFNIMKLAMNGSFILFIIKLPVLYLQMKLGMKE